MPKIDLEMQTLDYLVYQTNQLNHPVSNLVLNKYLFVINLINYVETDKFLFKADFIGFAYGPTDTNIYDEYNRKNKDCVDQLVAHDHVYYDNDILHIEQFMPKLSQTDPQIKQLVTKYLPNLLSYNFNQLVDKLNQPPYQNGYNKIYNANIYHDLKNYYQDIKNRFWMFNAEHQPTHLYYYTTNIKLEFNLTNHNAKLAEQYYNFEDVIRSTTVELIKRDYDVDLISYQWSFNQHQAQITAISDQPLSISELKHLNQYTQDDISDGAGENFTVQDFANLDQNQSVNNLTDFDLDDYNVLTLTNTPINFKLTKQA